MAILDQFGRPIERGRPEEPQTARLMALHREVAEHPVRGLTPAKLAAILEAAEEGDLTAQCDLFEDMEDRDGHILAEMSKRKRALLTLDWTVEPPREATAAEKKAAELAHDLLRDVPDFEDLVLDLADGIGKGFACCEIEWARAGRTWLPADIAHRPQRWFQFDQATRREIRLRDATAGADGAALQPFGWLVHTHRAKSGYLPRAALYRTLSWPFLFKWWSARDIAEFLEIYGLPVRVGTYPSGATDTEKATLLRAVAGMGHNAAGIIPEGMLVEFKEAAKGTHEPFAWFVDWCERTQSKAILGQVLSAEAKSTGLGSGVADLQGEVRDDILKADAAQVAGTLTRDLVYPLLVLNGVALPDGLRRCPRFVFDTGEAEDLALYADALPKLVAVGMKIPASYAHEKLRIPQPADGEDVLRPSSPVAQGTPPTPQPPPQGGGGKSAAARAALKADPAAGEPDPTPIEPIADRLAEEAAAPLSEWLASIEQLVAEADSLSDLRERLLAAFADLPADRLAGVMQAAFAVADLAGRYDVQAQSQ